MGTVGTTTGFILGTVGTKTGGLSLNWRKLGLQRNQTGYSWDKNGYRTWDYNGDQTGDSWDHNGEQTGDSWDCTGIKIGTVLAIKPGTVIEEEN